MEVQLSTVQTYLNTLHKRNEITLEDNLMRTKFAQTGHAHGLPKIHKDYQDIPSFWPIVDTTSTPHYGTAKRIKAIPPKLLNEGYKFISFDVTS